MCAQRSSALLLPWSRGGEEEGEQVAYLALGLQGTTLARDHVQLRGHLQLLHLHLHVELPYVLRLILGGWVQFRCRRNRGHL